MLPNDIINSEICVTKILLNNLFNVYTVLEVEKN